MSDVKKKPVAKPTTKIGGGVSVPLKKDFPVTQKPTKPEEKPNKK